MKEKNTMSKDIIAQGKLRLGSRDEIEWELSNTEKGPEFSASAGRCDARHKDYEFCGQCVDEIADAHKDNALAQRIREVWKRWHLNGMKAGCEHQRAEGWDTRPIDPSKPTNTYISLTREGETTPYYTGWNMLTWITRKENAQGLLSEPCPVCGYKYGSAWLHEAMPQELVDEIKTWKA